MKEKNILKKVSYIFLLFLFCTLAFQIPASAATVNAPSSSLKDVRKAKEIAGEWITTTSGVRFRTTEGKYLKQTWLKNNSNIYYINKKGYRVSKSWILYNKYYYYMNSAGKMVTGWMNKYYLKANGRRASGPTTIDGKAYFFNTKNGKIKTGWVTYKKKKYYYDPVSREKVTSKWVKESGKWKYLNDKGVMQKNTWIYIGKNKYYVDSSGTRVTGEQYINGKWYYFKKNGVLDPNKKITNTVDPSKKMVALTFDDGPGPYTSSLLKCLRENNARATFFMVGSQVSSYSSTVKQMFLQHCELGNHSYDHANLEYLSDSGISSEIQSTNNAIKKAAGSKPTVARLPYGAGHSNSRVLNAIGLPSIYWSIDTMDWANTGNPQHTINEVLNNVRSGDIVLMHDIHYSTVQAAKSIIPALRQRGYQMVTVTELAKYKGKKSLSSGRTYYSFR